MIKQIRFENISEFTRYLDKNKNVIASESASSRYDEDRWAGTTNWAEFEQLIQNGDDEITKEIRKWTQYYIDKFEELYAESIGWQFDVVGQFFDIGAVLVGEPEAWLNEIVVKDDKFIKLKINGVYPAKTDTSKVRRNASKVFGIAVALEKQGYLVEIDMEYRTENPYKNGDIEVTIPVKTYNSPLDYKKFGILLNVAFFRRGIFRLLEIECGKELRSGYGRTKRVEGDIQLDNEQQVDDLENKLREVA